MRFNNLITSVLFFLLTMVFSSSSWAETPDLVTFHGYLSRPDGSAVTTEEPGSEPVKMSFNLYAESVGGVSLWGQDYNSVKVHHGYFTVHLGGAGNPLPLPQGPDGNLFLGVSVNDGSELSPRSQLGSVPFALQARDAAQADYASDAGSVAGIKPNEIQTIAASSSATQALQDEINALNEALTTTTNTVTSLQLQMQNLLAEGTNACKNECLPDDTGCSDDGLQKWTCIENEEDGCWSKSAVSCTAPFVCDDGACVCKPDATRECAQDTVVALDSCGLNPVVIETCGEGLCTNGYCSNTLRHTPPRIGYGNEGSIASSGGHLFVAGASGKILHFDGTAWRTPNIGTTANITDIDAWGDGDNLYAWAVGDEGKVLRYRASEGWSSVPTGISANLRGVSIIGPDDVVCVGENATVIRYSAGEWTTEVWNEGSPWTNEHLNAVWAYGPTKIWAVGTNALILYNDGSGWTTQLAPPNNPVLKSVWGINESTVWATGDSGVYRISGGSWAAVDLGTTPDAPLNDIMGLSSQIGLILWAVGDSSSVYRLNVLNWGAVSYPDVMPIGPGINLIGVSAGLAPETPETGAWIVGADGSLFWEDGSENWTALNIDEDLETAGLIENSADTVLAIGGAGCKAFRKDGAFFKPVAVNGGVCTQPCTDCATPTAGETFKVLAHSQGGPTLVGSNEGWVYRYDPVEEALVLVGDQLSSGDTLSPVTGLASLSDTNQYALTANKLYKLDGDQWTEAGPGGIGLVVKQAFDISVLQANGVQQYDGSEWTFTQLPPATLKAIASSGSGDLSTLWVVGTEGYSFHFQNGTWTPHSWKGDGEAPDLAHVAIDVDGDAEVLTVDGRRFSLTQEGNWSEIKVPSGIVPSNLFIDGNGTVWLTGPDGYIATEATP